MAFTKLDQLTAIDEGDGGLNPGNPQYWHEDILLLINEENPSLIVERNIIFQNQELTGLMSDGNDINNPQHADNLVLLKCPPYFKPLEEQFKN